MLFAVCWLLVSVTLFLFHDVMMYHLTSALAPQCIEYQFLLACSYRYKHMCSLGWDKMPNVRVVFGRWQDVIDDLGQFDSIFFDTYGEYFEDMKELHDRLPRLLRPAGVYSFFNGLAPDNIFFHMVVSPRGT
jgi:hypothetical protein